MPAGCPVGSPVGSRALCAYGPSGGVDNEATEHVQVSAAVLYACLAGLPACQLLLVSLQTASYYFLPVSPRVERKLGT